MSDEKRKTNDNIYKHVIENVRDVIWKLDKDMAFTYVSPAGKKMSGYDAEEMLGRSLFDFLTAGSKALITDVLMGRAPKRVSGENSGIILYDVEFICRDNEKIWCEVTVSPIFESGRLSGYVGVTRNISEKKAYEKELEKILRELRIKNEQLEDIAALDMLTGAYNRRKLDYFFGLEIDKKEKQGVPFSIVMLDIDNFKSINDNNGHRKGDGILHRITEMILGELKEADKLFRWGGDEFIILIPGAGRRDAVAAADGIREAVGLSAFDIMGKRVTISLSAGEYRAGEDIDQFINRVDSALLKAKFNGRNRVEEA